MLLCAIVKLVSSNLNGAEVDKLADYIDKFNCSQVKLLGLVWLTFNNHNISHLPHFIKCFGSPQHFSSLPFERYNGLMGTILTSGHKGGMLEVAIMCNAAQRSKLQHLLAGSSKPFFETKLLELIEGNHPSDLSKLNTYLKKKALDDDTFGLLLDHLNHCTACPPAPAAVTTFAIDNTSQHPQHTLYWDTASPSTIACLDKQATFICTATMDRAPNAVKVGGVGQGGCNNQCNCWCLVMVDGMPQAAKILWIFSKSVWLHTTTLDVVQQTFMHIWLLWEVSVKDLGHNHPCHKLISVGDHGPLLHNVIFLILDIGQLNQQSHTYKSLLLFPFSSLQIFPNFNMLVNLQRVNFLYFCILDYRCRHSRISDSNHCPTTGHSHPTTGKSFFKL